MLLYKTKKRWIRLFVIWVITVVSKGFFDLYLYDAHAPLNITLNSVALWSGLICLLCTVSAFVLARWVPSVFDDIKYLGGAVFSISATVFTLLEIFILGPGILEISITVLLFGATLVFLFFSRVHQKDNTFYDETIVIPFHYDSDDT